MPIFKCTKISGGVSKNNQTGNFLYLDIFLEISVLNSRKISKFQNFSKYEKFQIDLPMDQETDTNRIKNNCVDFFCIEFFCNQIDTQNIEI